MRASATRLFRSVAVEVERKFKPSATAYALLQHGGLGSPGTGRRGEADAYGTSQLDESGGRVTEGEATGVGQWLHDLYLDAPDRRLSCSDRWLRRRGSGFSPTATQEGKLSGLGGQQRWELKRPAMPLGKEATDSEKPAVDHYEELEGHALKEALAIDTVTLPALKAAGLQPFALIVTRRRSAYGTVYPDVKLDLDEVWFADDDHEVLSAGWSPCGLPRFVTEREADYVIAEAEVMVQAGEDSPAALAAARLKAESRVLAFIQEELAADASTGVRGKVLECIYQRHPAHYDLLCEAGLLRQKLGA